MMYKERTEPKLNVSIRPLQPGEMEAFHALRLEGLESNPEAFGETAQHFRNTSASQLAESFISSERRGGFILGAFVSNAILKGVVGLSRSDSEKLRHRGTIWGMYVSSSERRTGLGRQLLQNCMARCEQNPDILQVHLSVVTSNEPAIKLYESLGFTIYGTEPRALRVGNDFFDAYLMVKMLRE